MAALLEMHDVTVGYGDGVVLSDVELRVDTHQAVCLLGRNGVGKTTLLKTLMGLLRPRSGRIEFDGHDIVRLTPNARARLGIGYVPQGRMIFPQLTVTDNLMVGLEAAPASGPRAADGLAGVYELFPVLEDVGKRQAGMLSGGQ